MDIPTYFAPPNHEYIICDAEDCNTIAPKLRCSRCRLVYYCSSQCQRKHWTVHKSDCRDVSTFKTQYLEQGGSHHSPVQSTSAQNDGIPMSADNTCAICLEDSIQNPHVLNSCRHWFCLPCLQAYQNKCKQMRQPLRCPICRADSEDIQRKHWETAFCLTCQAEKKGIESLERKELLQLALFELQQISKEDMKLYIQGMFTKMSIFQLLDDHESVLAIIQELVALDDSGRENLEIILKTLDETPSIHDDEAFIDLSQFHSNSVVRLNPNDRIQLFVDKAITYERLENWGQALQSYSDIFLEFQRLDIPGTAPHQRSVLMGSSRCFYHLKEYDQAIFVGEGGIQMNRHFPEAHKYVALSYKAKGDLDTAIKLMTQAVLYETPWDDDNIQKAKILLDELVRNKDESLVI